MYCVINKIPVSLFSIFIAELISPTTILYLYNNVPTVSGSDELEEYYVSERNEYFFDRSRSTFESILYFYQSNGVMCLPSSVNPDVFVEELKFFKFGEKIVAKFNAASNIKRESIKGEFKHTLKEKIWLVCFNMNNSLLIIWLRLSNSISLSVVWRPELR